MKLSQILAKLDKETASKVASIINAAREELGKFTLFGSTADIAVAKKVLTETLSDDEMIGKAQEGTLRLKVQDLIDKNNLKASILYNGNTVYGFNAIMKDFEKIVKGGVEKLTDKLYKFFSLNFTIAHYNINGWIATYPRLSDVLKILEKGNSRHTDVRRITSAMITKLKAAGAGKPDWYEAKIAVTCLEKDDIAIAFDEIKKKVEQGLEEGQGKVGSGNYQFIIR